MENNISVSLRDWEEKVRDQRSLEILSGLLNVDGYISVDHVRVILGLQVDKIPNVQPTEPAIWIDELVDRAVKCRRIYFRGSCPSDLRAAGGQDSKCAANRTGDLD